MRVNKRLVTAIRPMARFIAGSCGISHDDVRAFYQQFTGEVIVAFEASGYSAWFEQMLAELRHAAWLGNPAEIRRKAPRRQKNDRRDADLMLDLLLKGDFPRVHGFSEESRTVLRQLRYRHKLVKVRTIAKNSLPAISINAGLPLKRRLLTEPGIAQLQALSLSLVLTQQRDEWLQLIGEMNERIATVEAQLQQRAKDDAAIALLQTHPGIGLLTSLALRYTLLPTARFSTTRQVTAYVGVWIVWKTCRRSGGGWAVLVKPARNCCGFCLMKRGTRPRGTTRN
jgi:transposase